MSAIRVSYGQSVHGAAEIAAVVEVLESSTRMGARTEAFEARVAALFAKRFGIMVNSGSSALELAVALLELPAGAEVITPALTFATTVAPLVRAGLVPAFVDVEPGSYNIDAAKVEAMITPETRALLVPDLIGNLPDWDALRALADAHRLAVIEDSADTLGATLGGRPTGPRADICTTSFYGSHIVNCAGNGGLLALDDPARARRARLLRSWGRSSSLLGLDAQESVAARFDVEIDGIAYDRKFVFDEIGFNLEPSEIGAAFGLVQLDGLAQNIETRRRNFARHAAFFADYRDWFVLPRERAGARTGWLAFPLTIREAAPFSRRELQIHLEERNIQTRPVFAGNILRQPGFARIERREAPEGYPEADRVMRGGILIGCHHGLDDEQIGYLHATARAFLAGRGRA